MAILPPWDMLASMSRKAAGLPRHLQADVEALLHAEFLLHVGELSRCGRRRRASRPSCFASSRRYGFTSVTTTCRAPACRTTAAAMHADRAGAGDQHVLAEHVELRAPCAPRCRTDRRSTGTSRDRWCGHRATQTLVIGSDEVLGERAGAIDADALGVLAQMPPAGQAIAATPADDVPLAADDVADVEVLDVRADLDDLADELVADDHRHRDRLLGPGVPVVDVQVGAADAGPQDLDEHVVDADLRDRHFFQPEALAASLFTRAFIVFAICASFHPSGGS